MRLKENDATIRERSGDQTDHSDGGAEDKDEADEFS
jgi:hypothetical protein